jgi:hypothetical protein
VARSEHLVNTPPRARRRRLLLSTSRIPHSGVGSEWDAPPLGRLGRLLWADIDRYLEFVAIARSEPRRG